MTEIPTQEELHRVAAYWERVRLLACKHETLVFDSKHDGFKCGECHRPVQIMSDIQIEDMRR